MSDIVQTKTGHLQAIEVERGTGPIIRTMQDAWSLAQAYYAAGMSPRGVKSAAQQMLVFVAGSEVGLGPTASNRNIGIINNQPVLHTDAPIALVLRSGQLEYQAGGVEGEGDARYGWHECKRKGIEGVSRREFSVADAKAAGLWKKAGPWTTSPDRMLFVRPRAFNLRDVFGDILNGVGILEAMEEAVPLASSDAPVGSAGLLAALTEDEVVPEAVWDEVMKGAE